jgi:Rrf2 family protein
MKISKKTQYGLRAMVFLAKNERKVLPLSDISRKEKIPFHFLEKIILRLEKFGLVKAKKGFGGGYFLAKRPEKIKVGEIIFALEGKTSLVKCLESFCPLEKKCLTKNFWQKLNKTINSALNSINLADLIKN